MIFPSPFVPIRSSVNQIFPLLLTTVRPSPTPCHLFDAQSARFIVNIDQTSMANQNQFGVELRRFRKVKIELFTIILSSIASLFTSRRALGNKTSLRKLKIRHLSWNIGKFRSSVSSFATEKPHTARQFIVKWLNLGPIPHLIQTSACLSVSLSCTRDRHTPNTDNTYTAISYFGLLMVLILSPTWPRQSKANFAFGHRRSANSRIIRNCPCVGNEIISGLADDVACAKWMVTAVSSLKLYTARS